MTGLEVKLMIKRYIFHVHKCLVLGILVLLYFQGKSTSAANVSIFTVPYMSFCLYVTI